MVTLHRRENHKSIAFWYQQIEDIAFDNQDLNFVFVSHPNPNSQCSLHKERSNMLIIPPVHHKEFVKNHPYRKWFLVKLNTQYKGSIYIIAGANDKQFYNDIWSMNFYNRNKFY